MHPRRLAGLGLLALVWPSGALGVFDGLPLDTLSEAAALVALVALAAVRGPADAGSRTRSTILVVVALAIVALKSGLFVAGAHGGFAACYRPVVAEPQPTCARSWSNPLRLREATRFDPAIAFHLRGDPSHAPTGLSDSTWNLGMFNDLRFNHYPWEPGVPVRERLPFTAEWRWRSRDPDGLRIRYVGELTVLADGRARRFPPAYDEPTEVRVPGGEATRELAVRFRFDDGSVQPWSGSAPYARVEVRDASGLLHAPPAPVSHRLAGLAVDLLVLGLLGAALRTLARAVRRHAIPMGLALLPLLLAPIAPVLGGIGLAVFVLALAWRRDPGERRAALPAMVLLAAAASAAMVLAPSFGARDHVGLRNAGEDFLTYESFAREMLDTGSPRGGEDVFVYSPGFRYVHAGVRLLLGEGDALVTGVTYALLLCAGAALLLLFLPARPPEPPVSRARSWVGWATGALASLLLMVLLSVDQVRLGVLAPLSEWPTWTALLLAVPLLFAGGRGAQFVGCGLLALAFTIRAQQAPALLLLFVVFAHQALRAPGGRRHLARCAALVLGIALLPLLHNVVYGGQFALLPRTPRLPVNFPLPPGDLLNLWSDPAVARTLRGQLAAVLALPQSQEPIGPALRLLFHGLQALWVATAIWVVRVRVRAGAWPGGAALMLLPAAYLLPHLFVQVYVYYPRHIVAGHLAMAIAAVVALGSAPPAPQDA